VTLNDVARIARLRPRLNAFRPSNTRIEQLLAENASLRLSLEESQASSNEPVATPNAAQELSNPPLGDFVDGRYHGPSSALHNASILPHPERPDLLTLPVNLTEHNAASKELFAEASKQRKYRICFPEEQNEVGY